LFPLLFLGALLIAGGLFNFAALSALDFLTRPKGALLLAAAVSVWMTHPEHRRECLDVALRRCSSLLLVIGAASAFGLMLIKVLPIADLLPNGSVGAGQIAALFLVSVIFKIAYGSSTVALATVTSVLAPVVTPMLQTGAISIPAAIFAICLGSLVIIPTDSFYWLVRSDALGAENERSAIITLGGGAAVQAGVGLLVLIAISALHVI
jgi:GntP family gluconate:H+ symporter